VGTTTEAPYAYQRSGAARVLAALWLGVALVFLSQLVQSDSVGGHAFTAVLLAASLVGVVRAWRMNTVIAMPDRLVVRRFDRTWRVRWSEIRSIEAVDHVNGFRGPGLTLQITDASRPRKLREFFHRSPEGKARVKGIAQELERRRRLQDAAAEAL
jgi:hypothetical protein